MKNEIIPNLQIEKVNKEQPYYECAYKAEVFKILEYCSCNNMSFKDAINLIDKLPPVVPVRVVEKQWAKRPINEEMDVVDTPSLLTEKYGIV